MFGVCIVVSWSFLYCQLELMGRGKRSKVENFNHKRSLRNFYFQKDVKPILWFLGVCFLNAIACLIVIVVAITESWPMWILALSILYLLYSVIEVSYICSLYKIIREEKLSSIEPAVVTFHEELEIL